MPTEQLWEVVAKNTPLLKKICPKCRSDRFYCSDKFRINFNKKNIDIWLIYRCIKCESTYNLTISSRIKPGSISQKLLREFQENNTALAWKYAFSREIRRKNKVESDFQSVEYEVRYDYRSVERLQGRKNEFTEFKVQYPLDFNLRLSSVIRTCLELSAHKLDQLIALKAISIGGRYLEKKHKISDGDTVRIDIAKLKTIFS